MHGTALAEIDVCRLQTSSPYGIHVENYDIVLKMNFLREKRTVCRAKNLSLDINAKITLKVQIRYCYFESPPGDWK